MLAEHLTLLEAARYLGVSRAKLSRLAKEGVVVFRPNPLDRRVKLFRVDDLDELLIGPRRLHPASHRSIAAL
ncbi:MAG: helix-turn-helix domain-containing protein [Chloroflexi bacterium]|nr:helix-turn-helix domain-containing protein [Chloroflexota bacterium]